MDWYREADIACQFRDGTAGAHEAHSQPDHEASPFHRFLYFPWSCVPSLSPRVNKPIEVCSLMAGELQNRVTLEKLKSWSVIAGTSNLPVSDVIASDGLVNAATWLKTRRGLS